MGSQPSSAALARVMTTTAAAASFRELELAAVTVPVPSKTKHGLSRARPSAVTPSRGFSSVSTTVTAPLRPGTLTATISSAKTPSATAFTARCWLRAANSSCSSRVTLNSRATFSAVTPLWDSSRGQVRMSMTPSSKRL